ncbi:DUF4249 domain-containing protein [Maribellus luteus]|uniref:DUF4249 domain-containing protein n=1 Tax=Maribellus luteus TaxID=2305463 RepID=A0A399T0C2_9BACT|nr:DUF4249 domain-containing protein [Maribellus luteus]RIJ47433.1 DUF4249 domain-containing protein [Maribellus luteus]
MNTIKTFTLLLGIVALFTSCRDIIDIELDSVEPKLVIDGAVTDINDTLVIQLTKSVDYFEPGIYPPVPGAVIAVSDNLGNTHQLNETSSGVYTDYLPGTEGNKYTLSVEVEGEKYTAEVEMPYKVLIDSISVEPTPDYLEFSGGYLVNCHLHDPFGVENFYRLKVSLVNDLEEPDDVLVVYDDAYVNGNQITLRWDEEQFFPQDTVVVELQTLAESTYEYYRTLSALFESGMIGSANPANPITNLSGDVLGYFGAYTVSRDTIIISE